MLEVKVNGTTQKLPQPLPLSQALEQWGYQGRHFAVAINGNFVPRSQHASVTLEGGEALDIVAPMQGG